MDVLQMQNDILSRNLMHLGGYVGKNPGIVCTASIVFVLVCCIGFINFTFESDIEDLWLPMDSTIQSDSDRQGSINKRDEAWDAAPFEPGAGYERGEGANRFTIEMADGSDILTKAALLKLLSLWQTTKKEMACDTFGTSVLGYFRNRGAVDDPILAPEHHTCPGCYDSTCTDDDDGYGYSDEVLPERERKTTDREDSGEGSGDGKVVGSIGANPFDLEGAGNQIKAVVDGMTEEEVHAKLLSLLQTYTITKDQMFTPWSQVKTRRFNQDVIGGITCGGVECTNNDAPATGANALRVYLDRLNEDGLDRVLAEADGTFRITAEFDSSLGEELFKSINAGYLPNGIGYSLMLTWMCMTIGGLHKLKGMPLVGMGCIATVLLSTAAGFGLCLAFGVKFTPITPVLPIMLLGVGIDDAYVLIGAYKDTPKHLPVEERIKFALANGGLAVTMTSLTDVAAFAAGAFAKVGAIQSFCTMAAVAIAIDYLLQITLFLSFLTWDRRRVEENRLWTCCCMTAGPGYGCCTCINERCGEDDADAGDSHDDEGKGGGDGVKGGGEDTSFQKFLREKWAPLVLHPISKVVILILFSGLLGMFTYFATLTPVAQEAREITPTGSYMVPAEATDEKYFLGREGELVEIWMGQTTNSWNTIKTQDAVLDILDKVEASGAVATDWAGRGTQCWVREFVQVWLPANTGGVGVDCADSVSDGRTSQFAPCLLEFNVASETAFAGVNNNDGTFPIFFSENATALIPWHVDFLYDSSTPAVGCPADMNCPTGGTLTSSRCWTRFPKAYTKLELLDQAKHMGTIREVVAASSGDLGAFAMGNSFFNLERYLGFLPTTKLNVASAFVACMVVCWFFLMSPVLVLLVGLMVVCIDAWLFGLMTLWNVNLNESSVVCVVMACGFAVDFCAHVGHSFKYATGSGDERAAHAIVNAGRAIANAGFTTLLATTCLIAGGAIFVTFSKMFTGIVIFGLLHALVLLPVVLSLCACIIPSAPEEQGASKIPTPALLGFRRYFTAFVGLAGVGLVGVALGMPWVQYSGSVIQRDFNTGSAITYEWQATFYWNKFKSEYAECPAKGCDSVEQLTFVDYANATGTVLTQPVYNDLVQASKSMAVPAYFVSVVLGLVSVIITVVAKTSAQHGAAAGVSGLAAFVAFLAAGLYQNAFNDYLNKDVEFTNIVTEYDAVANRHSGFVILFGSLACFLFVTVNNLTIRAEGGADRVGDNTNDDDTFTSGDITTAVQVTGV